MKIGWCFNGDFVEFFGKQRWKKVGMVAAHFGVFGAELSASKVCVGLMGWVLFIEKGWF